MPSRLRRTRAPGWQPPAGAVYVGRPSRWGNPHRHDGTAAGRAHVVAAYRQHLAGRPDLVAAARAELAGRDLVCWCPPDHPCHADVLLDVANGPGAAGAGRAAGSPAEARLRDRAWRHVESADGPVTAAGIAKATRVTSGAALRWLAEWVADGRLVPGNPPAGRHAPGHVPYLPAGGRFRVLVTGSRAWTDAPAVDTVLDELRAEHPADLVIVHGACPSGADAIADTWARRHSITVERWPADWRRLGRRAGMERNTAMVATGPARCVAFIRDNSPGATHCAHAAEAAAIPTTRHQTTTPVEARPAMPPDNPLLAAALDYAARGWHVIPLRPGQKRPAFPDHDTDHCPGRDPRCRDGHTGWEPRATTDPDRIRRAWTAGRYGLGVACGPSGLLVVDLDTPKPDTGPPPAEWALPGVTDGADVFAVLCEQAGQPWPVTYTVTTPRRGKHLYFRHPADGPRLGNTAGAGNGLGWLIDTRGHGGQVAAPPTTVAGRPYTVTVDTDPAPLPGWLAALLRPQPLPAPVVLPTLPGDRAGKYAATALTAECARLAAAPAQGHNDALYRAARILGELVAGGAIPEPTVRAALADTAAALAAGAGCDCTERGIDRTIASGLRAGARRPRTVAA